MVCRQRLDFYWQSISGYAVVLIIYILLRGTIEDFTLSLRLVDPIVILLCIFIVTAGIGALVNLYKRREIAIGKDFIEFRSRFGVKVFHMHDILRISFGKVHGKKIKNTYRLIKISVKGRRRAIRIRPSSYTNEEMLGQAVARLKKSSRPRGQNS